MSENKDSKENIKLAKKHKEDNKFAWDASSIVIEYSNADNTATDETAENKQARDKLGRFSYGDDGSSSGGESTYSTKYSNMDRTKFNETIKKEYGKQASFTTEQIKAVHKYAEDDFVDVNKFNNNPKDITIKKDKKELASLSKTMDGSMKNSLKENTVLYRGVKANGEYKVGAKVTEKSFVSTSFRKEMGEKYASDNAGYGNTPTMLKINAPKNQKGVIPLVVGEETYLSRKEAEFIMPRNTTFKVTNISIEKSENYNTEMRVVELSIIQGE